MSVQGLHPAEVLLPFQFAVQVETIESARTEEGVKTLAVGDGRIGRQASGFVTALVQELLAHNFLPENLPVTAADGEDDELVTVGNRHVVVCTGGVVIDRLLCVADGHGSGEGDPGTGDGGRGM